MVGLGLSGGGGAVISPLKSSKCLPEDLDGSYETLARNTLP